MDWATLLNEERFFWPPDLTQAKRPEIENKSWVFQQDAARISSSSAFRRLQAKTQVLPFPKTDYPRTRLTHTIEVSNVGRRLALNVGRRIAESSPQATHLDPIDLTAKFVEITAAACLAHDIGNPPFGHAGEDAIKAWFESNFSGAPTFPKLAQASGDVLSDFTKFDGNAQGYRVLTYGQGWGREGGLQLSLAVLGAFSKYPRTSKFSERDKYGVMREEAAQAASVFATLGMQKIREDGVDFEFARHPLAYIVEAADDIAYLSADLEDAVRAGVIEFEQAEELLMPIAARSGYKGKQTEKMKRYEDLKKDEFAKLRYLRTHATTEMVREAEVVFFDKLPLIMSGTYRGEILRDSQLGDKIADIKSISNKEIHNARGKIENEIAGKNVIFGLLNIFAEAFETLLRREGLSNVTDLERKLLRIFPWDNYFSSEAEIDGLDAARLLYMLVDYISGMTDRYASSMFRQLSGHQQPFANW